MKHLNQSARALRWSVTDFILGGGRYFWTLTTADVVEPDELSARWNVLGNYLRKTGVQGIRVYEMHPGGHGYHIHMLVDRYMDVNRFRKVTEACGFGRIHVARIKKRDAERVSGYLAKYLCKGREMLKRGMRAWAGFGKVNYTRVRQAVFDGPHRVLCDWLKSQGEWWSRVYLGIKGRGWLYRAFLGIWHRQFRWFGCVPVQWYDIRDGADYSDLPDIDWRGTLVRFG